MVKGITLVQEIASGETFERLSSLFGSLGFEPGKGWNDGLGRGAAFLAPDLVSQIVEGRQVPALTASRLRSLLPLPSDWQAQRALFASLN